MKKRTICAVGLLALAVGCLLFPPARAHAGGFAIQEQSGRGLGQAFAGVATGLGDGSSAWYNPAAMTRIRGSLFHSGNHLILPVSDEAHDNLTARGGVSFERSPIKNGVYRTPRIPDNDRWWATIGVTYAIIEELLLDVSYAHLFVQDAGSKNVNSTGVLLDGEYELSVDIVSLALTWEI